MHCPGSISSPSLTLPILAKEHRELLRRCRILPRAQIPANLPAIPRFLSHTTPPLAHEPILSNPEQVRAFHRLTDELPLLRLRALRGQTSPSAFFINSLRCELPLYPL